MARRRGGRRRGRKAFKVPVVSLAILVGQAAVANSLGGSLMDKALEFQSYYTGFKPVGGVGPGFVPGNLLIGWGPWFAKGLASRVARGMGATPRIPFGLPISIS